MKVTYRRSTDVTMVKIMAKVTRNGVFSARDRGCGGHPDPFSEGVLAQPLGGAGGSLTCHLHAGAECGAALRAFPAPEPPWGRPRLVRPARQLGSSLPTPASSSSLHS